MRVIICFLLLFGLSVFPPHAQQSPDPNITGPSLTGALKEILIEWSNQDCD
jgi:hypothetical protein